MKGNNITIVIILAAAGIGYYLWTKRRKAAESLGATAGAAAGSAAVTAAANTAGQIGIVPPILQTGGSAAGVIDHEFTETEINSLLSTSKPAVLNETRALQIYLNEMGANLIVDGQFGQATETALNSKKGKKNITLKELKIAKLLINNSGNYVFGRATIGSGLGLWNGTSFSGIYGI